MTSNISDSPARQPALRAELARVQGVFVSAADEERIARITDGISAALLKSPLPSLFDTEPAHFDRALISGAAAGATRTRGASS
ncbi:hypothetical protein [Roseinatronobacter sp. NSM]|uniref:hypothetical protein n=1 Tax=Roseinatronobacter sp. NSM TaxID=3457785 RepID=UPI0040355773